VGGGCAAYAGWRPIRLRSGQACATKKGDGLGRRHAPALRETGDGLRQTCGGDRGPRPTAEDSLRYAKALVGEMDSSASDFAKASSDKSVGMTDEARGGVPEG
jgi:hypothetical protein